MDFIVFTRIGKGSSIESSIFLALFFISKLGESRSFLIDTVICLGLVFLRTSFFLTRYVSIIFGIALATAIVGAVIGTSVSGFIEKMPFYEEKFNNYWAEINQWAINIGWFEKNSGIEKHINPSSIVSIAGSIFTGLGNLMSDFMLVLLVVIFMLLEISMFIEKMKLISTDSLRNIDNIMHNMNTYFGTKAITSLVTGILVTIALAIIGVDFPILWGFLAFLLNFIPNIGSIIAAIPAVLLALVQLGLTSAIEATVVYLAVNGIIGNMVEPKIMGKNLGLSSLIVFLSMIFWGWILGTVGMLLAVPLTMTIKIIFDSMEETKHIGLLMGDESSVEHFNENKFNNHHHKQ